MPLDTAATLKMSPNPLQKIHLAKKRQYDIVPMSKWHYFALSYQ